MLENETDVEREVGQFLVLGKDNMVQQSGSYSHNRSNFACYAGSDGQAEVSTVVLNSGTGELGFGLPVTDAEAKLEKYIDRA